ncbi:hypothetical protein [Lysobacter solisilvae (ex Woo and Kim 2020)]|uniref:Uncharacterized protein n=1 Tax=Agrilutibacter terrestris TaxID=2865112 RepID=A0A7H0FUN0_9GAMM|nr:hypothetical protein [Lysobacter terrestris]QNP39746.1 hypothetical protein H8B22_09495 [Lysobacter terrestris]
MLERADAAAFGGLACLCFAAVLRRALLLQLDAAVALLFRQARVTAGIVAVGVIAMRAFGVATGVFAAGAFGIAAGIGLALFGVAARLVIGVVASAAIHIAPYGLLLAFAVLRGLALGRVALANVTRLRVALAQFALVLVALAFGLQALFRRALPGLFLALAGVSGFILLLALARDVGLTRIIAGVVAFARRLAFAFLQRAPIRTRRRERFVLPPRFRALRILVRLAALAACFVAAAVVLFVVVLLVFALLFGGAAIVFARQHRAGQDDRQGQRGGAAEERDAGVHCGLPAWWLLCAVSGWRA